FRQDRSFVEPWSLLDGWFAVFASKPVVPRDGRLFLLFASRGTQELKRPEPRLDTFSRRIYKTGLHDSGVLPARHHVFSSDFHSVGPARSIFPSAGGSVSGRAPRLGRSVDYRAGRLHRPHLDTDPVIMRLRIPALSAFCAMTIAAAGCRNGLTFA